MSLFFLRKRSAFVLRVTIGVKSYLYCIFSFTTACKSVNWANLNHRFALKKRMLLIWGYFTGSVTSFRLCAADCTACFQKATGFQSPACPRSWGWSLPGSCTRSTPHITEIPTSAQISTSAGGEPSTSQSLSCWWWETFLRACVNSQMAFPGLEDFTHIYLLIYLSAEG